MQWQYCFQFTFVIAILTKLSSTIGNYGGSEECSVEKRSDYFGKVAFCRKFRSNVTSYYLPSNTTRLRIYYVYDLPLTIPLACNLNWLTTLELESNKLQNVSREMFQYLNSLTEISLKNNYIKNLPEDVFRDNLMLTSVDLSENYLLSFEAFSKALKDLKFLKYLYLSDNKLLRFIHEKETDVLKNLSVQHLDVSLCTIGNIEEKAFLNFNNISSLTISNNPLNDKAMRNLSYSLNLLKLKEFRATSMTFMSYFSPYFLYQMQRSGIEYLDISNNRCLNFPSGSYPKLKELILIESRIQAILPDSFSGMPNLEKLILRKHYIQRINGLTFSMNTKLKKLDLSDYLSFDLSDILIIDDYSFKNQKDLEILSINVAPIRGNLRRFVLYGLTNLKELNLHSGALTDVDEYSFETLSSLRYLDLSYNHIVDISEKSFYGLKSVRTINLSHNRLTHFKSSLTFRYTPNLEILTLNSNKIQRFPNGIFLKLNSLGMLQASDNIILPWNENLLPQTSNMTVLITQKNTITHFTEVMFQDISQLEFFDFSENPLNCSFCSTIELQKWMRTTNTSIVKLTENTDYYSCTSPDFLSKKALKTVNLEKLKLDCTPREVDILKITFRITSCIALISLSLVFVWLKFKWNIKYTAFLLRKRIKQYKEEVNTQQYTFDAFVSHCEDDLPWVRKELLPTLETSEADIKLCAPDRDICPGNSIFKNFRAAIENSRTTIIVLSNNYMDSNWNMFEAQIVHSKFFEDKRNGLILIFLEPILKSKITKNLCYVMKTRTCIRWTKNPAGQKLFWERLKLAVKKPKDKGISTHIT